MKLTSKIIKPTIHNTFTRLAGIYKIDKDRFIHLLDPLFFVIKKENPHRKVLSPNEVDKIMIHLGLPDKEYCFGVDPTVYRTNTKLAELYNVDYRTLNSWIKPIKERLLQELPKRRYYYPREVKMIIQHLGPFIGMEEKYDKEM